MGPVSRYLGPEVPDEELLWQDPVPKVDHELVEADEVASLKTAILDSGLSVSQLVYDGVGVGVDLPRQRQARRRQRGAHSPRAAEELGGQPARAAREACWRPWRASSRTSMPRAPTARRCRWPTSSCWEAALRSRRPPKTAGYDVEVPFAPGRTDATQAQTDVEAFSVLEPKADGFRNYLGRRPAPLRRGATGRQGAAVDPDRARR